MRQTRNAGDLIDHGSRITRYAMIGDTYMNSAEIDDRANTLYAAVQKAGYVSWLTETAVRLHLGESTPAELAAMATPDGRAYGIGTGALDAVYILAKADVTWSDICWMKS